MADTPSDDTPNSAPPPRRRTRGGKGAAKSAGNRAKVPAKPVTRRAVATNAPKAAAPKKGGAAVATTAKPAAPKTPRKPRAATAPAPAAKRGFGRIFAITAATVLSVAAGAAAIFGRRKIAKVSDDTVGSVVSTEVPNVPVSAD